MDDDAEEFRVIELLDSVDGPDYNPLHGMNTEPEMDAEEDE